MKRGNFDQLPELNGCFTHPSTFQVHPPKKRKPGNGSCQLNLNLILKIATIKSFDDTHSIGA